MVCLFCGINVRTGLTRENKGIRLALKITARSKFYGLRGVSVPENLRRSSGCAVYFGGFCQGRGYRAEGKGRTNGSTIWPERICRFRISEGFGEK